MELNLRKSMLMTAGALGSICLLDGVEARAEQEPSREYELASADDTVFVFEDYQSKTLSSPKFVQPLVDTPISVTIMPELLLEEQGVNTLRDALRNVTGISIQAGEGNPPSGDALKIRGFTARDDILRDGMRDVGNYFRDQFNIETIEVTKGPSSAISGRGNTGGTINMISKTPKLSDRHYGEISAGTSDQYRGSVDSNFVLSEEGGIALRLNAVYHNADEPGRRYVNSERWGFAPSLAFGLGTDTRVTLSYLHMEQDEQPDYGLPNARNFSLLGSGFEGRVAPVDFRNYYGYSTDYRDVSVDVGTIKVEHDFNDDIRIQSQLRYGRTHNDAILSAPRFVGNVTTLGPNTQVVGNQKPRDQVDQILVSQTDLKMSFDTGAIRHNFVAGVELSTQQAENKRRLDVNGPATNLFNPVFQAAPPIAYNGTRAKVTSDVASVYVFDNIELAPQWQINGGVRWDHVKTRAQGFDDNGIAPGFVTDLTEKDNEWSGNASLVFKPADNGSIYLGWGTSFETSGRFEIVQLAGGNNNPPTTPATFNVDPERSQSFEIGTKWDVMDGKLQLTGAIFRIEKTNARTPGANPGDPPVVLDGEQRVEGVELGAAGSLTANWKIFAGYTYLDGKVTRSNNPIEQGARLDNTPKHSFNAWSTVQVTPELVLGGGVQYVGSRLSDIRQSATGNIVIEAEDYWLFDAVASYQLTENVALRLNVYNIGDKKYVQSFSSAQSIPGARRSAVLSLGLSL
ncbi:TonB-dependent siderophore receptor [Iodidimonas sp. SYSU 1G8]|uniref:TonB-dependent receptor n=1 Tax=Iodidimonas sp. SYSU 1G8 TaxID=3133967 RepID=UPI0031FEE995